MIRCRQAWFPTMVAVMLLASGCPVTTTSGDAGPRDGGDLGGAIDAGNVCADIDADTSAFPTVGGPCCDEGLFHCSTPTYQCCHGVWIQYNDGPCQPRPYAGPPDCTTYPATPGCPCAVGSTMLCAPFQREVECVGGVWTSSSTHACCN